MVVSMDSGGNYLSSVLVQVTKLTASYSYVNIYVLVI